MCVCATPFSYFSLLVLPVLHSSFMVVLFLCNMAMLIYMLIHSSTHLLTHLLTHPLTYSLTSLLQVGQYRSPVTPKINKTQFI
ncbi:hypothetical protein BDF14DRAFT_1839912, partial [Spinellus fusiger]